MKERRVSYYLGLVTQLGSVMLGFILAGLFFGMFLDRKLGLRGWCASGFALLGILAGLYCAYRVLVSRK